MEAARGCQIAPYGPVGRNRNLGVVPNVDLTDVDVSRQKKMVVLWGVSL